MREIPKSESITEFSARLERERIANWMWDRANLLVTVDPAGAMELSICSSAIRSNKLGPDGMHADEPRLKEIRK